MQPLVALLICFAIFAVGDAISTRTKAVVSSLFVASVLFLLGFWTFFPKDITTKATLQATGALAVPLLITHMGTLMGVRELIDQWRTVVAAVGAVAGIGLILATLGVAIFGKTIALVAAPPIAGGVVASLIMTEAAKARGAADMAVLATLLLVVQGFFGYPIASICLLREGKRILSGAGGTTGGPSQSAAKAESRKIIPPIPENYRTPAVYLVKLAIGAWLSVYLAGLTRGLIHQYVMCLIVGVILSEIGFLEKDIMTRANASGYLMLSLLAIVMANLSGASPQTLVRLLWPLFGTIVLGVIGIVIVSWLLHKPLGLSTEMAVAIGSTALFGFPGTYIISHEAAKGVASNEEERQLVLQHILPKMLVAGFCTVTITSVVLAGILSKYL